jgi:hypothetical protein
MLVLIGVLVLLFIVAFAVSESGRMQRRRERWGAFWYPGDGGGSDGSCADGSGGFFGGGDFGGGGGGDGGGGGGC